jgi:anti-sigma B factor antagonist
VARERPTLVRVNMAEVDFLDSSGLGVLVAAMRAAEDVRATYRVEQPNAKVLDQVQTTGLLEAFGLDDPLGGSQSREGRS